MVKIAVLVSGGGTNLEALFKAEESGILHSGKISLVVSDREGAYAITRAEGRGVKALTLNRKEMGRRKFEAELLSLLESEEISLIVLAGFLSILSGEFISHYEDRIINIHPALIPSFCGKGYYGLHVHEAALERGVKVTGATVHLVNSIPDGGRILLQKAVEIKEDDTPETLQKRVMEEAEWILLPKATELMAAKIGGRMTLETYLKSNSYPGRLLLAGNTEEGAIVAAYAIMGRSANSRNRLFSLEEGVLKTLPFDETKVEDPSLIIYNAGVSTGNYFILTNGDQSDTIKEYLERGKSFSDALLSRTYEPDAPNFTSRISALFNLEKQRSSLSIIRKKGEKTERIIWDYPVTKGMAHLIHTYEGDGDPLPPFSGDPEFFQIPSSLEELSNLIWSSLDEENRISLYVRVGEKEVVINKN